MLRNVMQIGGDRTLTQAQDLHLTTRLFTSTIIISLCYTLTSQFVSSPKNMAFPLLTFSKTFFLASRTASLSESICVELRKFP